MIRAPDTAPACSAAPLTLRRRSLRPTGAGRVVAGVLALSLAALLYCTASAAQGELDPYRLYLAERGAIPWNSLSPEERQALERHRGEWDDYSTDRQERMRKGAERYLSLPPDKRREVERQRREYQQLSPQERERLREEYKRKQR
jgi:hypothetical protein